MCVDLACSISQRRDAVVQRRHKVKGLEQQRTNQLQASLAWQQFNRDADEVYSSLCRLPVHTHNITLEHWHTLTCSHTLTHSQVNAWIQEKLKTACDESYRDPTNLQTKLQKHQAFEAELAANKGRVDGVCTRGSELIAGGNYMSEGVRERVNTLTQDWKKLTTASADKGGCVCVGVWAGVCVCGKGVRVCFFSYASGKDTASVWVAVGVCVCVCVERCECA